MKKTTAKFIATVAIASFLGLSCTPTYKSVKRMQKMEEGVANPTTKEELEEAIKKYESRALDLVTTESQIGIWYKILGSRYLEQQMYGKAFDSFRKAIEYYPNNANLYYYVAICAGYLSKSELDYEAAGSSSSSIAKKANYLKLSEQSFKRALELNPKYYKAMYGIGVLYAFQLNEDEKAIPYLEKFLETQVRNTDAMFVLAKAFYCTYQFDKAIELYDKIIQLKPNPEKVMDAEANKKKCLDAQYSK